MAELARVAQQAGGRCQQAAQHFFYARRVVVGVFVRCNFVEATRATFPPKPAGWGGNPLVGEPARRAVVVPHDPWGAEPRGACNQNLLITRSP